MSVFVLDKESREVDTMLPDSIFWILLYWLIMWAMFLQWYSQEVESGQRPKMSWLILVLTFLFVGFVPLLFLFFSIKKAIEKTKR
jgi:phosphoglycerol transferase MdoB-like AlkP superfamily enzyme